MATQFDANAARTVVPAATSLGTSPEAFPEVSPEASAATSAATSAAAQPGESGAPEDWEPRLLRSIQERPVVTVLAAVAVGYVMARLVTRAGRL